MTDGRRWCMGGLLALAGIGSACGGEDESGVGRLTIVASGEEAAKDGYPVGAGTPDEIGFADGWTMSFDRVLVSVRDLRVETRDGDSAGVTSDHVVFDLHAGDPLVYDFGEIPARRWDAIAFRTTRAAAGMRNVGDVDAAAVDRMIADGWSLLLEGTATRGAEAVTFSYGFDLEVDNHGCENDDGTLGVVVPTGGTAEGQMTFHLDHLFFDSFVSEEPSLRFDAQAATADAMGHVTLESLETQDLTNLLGADGMPLRDDNGNPLVYDPGSTRLRSQTLRGFIEAQLVTLGHWNGEGHCAYTTE